MDFNTSISKLQTSLQTIATKIKGGRESDIDKLKNNRAGSLTSAIKKPLFNILGKYSYNHEDVLGLEISPHYIRICQMKQSYGKWSLNQLASSCMESQFTNMDILMNQDLYIENLQALLKKHNIKTKDVALSVPTSASIIKIINMPNMDDEDLAGAASMGGIWESMVNLSGSINEYSVYYKVLRRNIKPSTSLSIKEIEPIVEESSLDSLLGGEAEIDLSTFGMDGSTTTDLPQTEAEQVTDLLGQVGLDTLETATEITTENIIPEENGYISTAMESNVGVQEISTEVIIEEEIIPEASEERALVPPEEIQEEITPEEDANSMDVLFVATKLADTQLYMNIAQKSGLQPIAINVKCNSLKQAFETNPEKDKIGQPYALLEFGADENYIYIIENMRANIFNINISDSDKQLMAQNKNNSEALQGFIQSYAEQLLVILDNYTKQNTTGNKVCDIFVSSNTALHVDDASAEPLINIFIEKISEMLGGYKLSPCTFCNHIEVPADFAKKVNAEGNLSSWATVLGLATYKLDVFNYNNEGAAIDRVNLLPGYKTQIKNRVTSVLSTLAMAAIFACVMIISGASFIILSAHNSSLTGEIKSLAHVKDEFNNKNNELQKLSIVMGKVKSLDKVRAAIPSNQTQILSVYKDMTSSIPEGVWLNDISFTPPTNIEIQGRSINDQNILEFVKRLNKSGGFKKISLKTMEALNKNNKSMADGASTPVKKFTLQGELGDDAGAEKLELISGGVK